MSEEISHLLIGDLIEEKIVIGPIVLPGKSPCLNCINLYRAEQLPYFGRLELLAGFSNFNLELPSAQVALIAGLVATQVIEFCEVQSGSRLEAASELAGITQSINLLDPLNLCGEKRYHRTRLCPASGFSGLGQRARLCPASGFCGRGPAQYGIKVVHADYQTNRED